MSKSNVIFLTSKNNKIPPIIAKSIGEKYEKIGFICFYTEYRDGAYLQ